MQSDLKAGVVGDKDRIKMLSPCYVLEDGRRVLSQSKSVQALGMTWQSDRLGQVTGSKALKPYISQDVLIGLSQPIIFRDLKNREVPRSRSQSA